LEKQHKDDGKYGDISTVLEAAAYLENKGFSVIPLRQPYKHVLGSYFAKKNGKYPASILPLLFTYIGRKANIRAFASRPNANIGVLTGRRYNLVIVDVDFPQGGKSSMEQLDLPSTLTVLTGNGLHLYYRHPGGKVPTCAGRLAPGIDVKGERSFATAPPSLHYSGTRYNWLVKARRLGNGSKRHKTDLLAGSQPLLISTRSGQTSRKLVLWFLPEPLNQCAKHRADRKQKTYQGQYVNQFPRQTTVRKSPQAVGNRSRQFCNVSTFIQPIVPGA